MEAPYILHALPSQSVLRKKITTNSAISFWTMNYFLAGEDQQQTNQPNDLAGD